MRKRDFTIYQPSALLPYVECPNCHRTSVAVDDPLGVGIIYVHKDTVDAKGICTAIDRCFVPARTPASQGQEI